MKYLIKWMYHIIINIITLLLIKNTNSIKSKISSKIKTSKIPDGWYRVNKTNDDEDEVIFYYRNGKQLHGVHQLNMGNGLKYYYFNETGVLQKGWIDLDLGHGKNTYCFCDYYGMTFGWNILERNNIKEWFYFDNDGTLAYGFKYLPLSIFSLNLEKQISDNQHTYNNLGTRVQCWFYFDKVTGALYRENGVYKDPIIFIDDNNRLHKYESDVTGCINWNNRVSPEEFYNGVKAIENKVSE